MLEMASDYRCLLKNVGLIQLLAAVCILAIAALREVSAADRVRRGIGKLASMPDSDPRLQFETTIENGQVFC